MLNKSKLLIIFIFILFISFGFFNQSFWIINQNKESFEISSFQVYIKIFVKILSVFLIMPLFMYKEKEIKDNSKFFLVSIFLITLIFMVIISLFSPLVVKQMKNINDSFSENDLWIFILTTNSYYCLLIIQNYLIFDLFLTEKKNKKIFMFLFLFLVNKIIIDLFFISDFSPFEFKVYYISISNLINVSIVIAFLFFNFYFKNKDNKKKIKINELKKHYKKGILPAIESTIGNLSYIFITLQILNSLNKDNYWASWQLSDSIILWGIMNFTLVFRYYIYYETLNCESEEEMNKKQSKSILYCFFIFLFLTIFYILVLRLLFNFKDENEWMKLTIKTLIMMSPIMYLEEIKKQLEIRVINKNKFEYILLNTVLLFIFLKIPILIVFLAGVKINYFLNYFFWSLGIVINFALTYIEFKNIDKVLKIIKF